MMQRYSDIDRDSGVIAFEYGSDYIRIQFRGGTTYLYTYGSAGQFHIEAMKSRANQGDGLNAYINNHTKKFYARKEK